MESDTTQSAATQGFDAVLALEEELTADRRLFAAGALTWRETPLPLMMLKTKSDGHEGAVIVGRIDRLWREGSEIRAAGTYADSEEGREAERLVAEQMLRWVSIDLDEYEVEEPGCDPMLDEDCESTLRFTQARIMGATMVAFPAFPAAVIVPSGAVIPAGNGNGRPAAAAGDPFIDDLVDTTVAAITNADTSTATSVQVANTRLRVTVLPKERPMESITAHALRFPAEPPAEWFTNPVLSEPTPITVTPEGRIYGHAALFDTCHIGRAGVCTTPPNSKAAYAYFRTGSVKCPDGCEIPTGTITLNTGHAELDLDAYSAAAHYDHTGSGVADVACGEDEYGIWFSGALRPTVTDEQLRILRASAISGDWRPIGGSLELVAMLAVNTPGFPVLRPMAASGARAHVKDGVQTALVAAAGPTPEHPLIRRIADLEQRLAAVESVSRPLRPAAAAAIRERLH